MSRTRNALSQLRPRRIDLLWLILMAALAGLGLARPRHSPNEFVALGGLAVAQIAEMRFDFFRTRWGALLAVGIKLLLTWILVYFTGQIESSYYLLFVLPVVSAASAFGMLGTLLTALASSAVYCSFLLLVDWNEREMDWTNQAELGIRVLFLVTTAILVNYFATENRRQSERYRKVAEDLAEANRELGQAQAQARRSERLAALGQLSAGLAHELRNPLGVIRGSAELVIKNSSQENEITREMATLIAREVDRTNSLVTRFLDFARPSRLHRDSNDLKDVIERALAQVERGLPPGQDHLHIETSFSPDLGPFTFDAELLERVFFNLALNGIQAMPQGGTLRVATRKDGVAAEVEISDTGAGIAPENMESIFNPFFTTKPEGVGLGLAIVSKIVDDHGGKITVSSEPGRGTTFKVSLPAA